MITFKHHIISAYKTKHWLVEEAKVVCVLFLVMDLACNDSIVIASTVLRSLDAHEVRIVDWLVLGILSKCLYPSECLTITLMPPTAIEISLEHTLQQPYNCLLGVSEPTLYKMGSLTRYLGSGSYISALIPQTLSTTASKNTVG